MSTRNLIWWIALLGGAEIALRGHLAADAALFHAGTWLLICALASHAWRTRGLRAAGLGVGACVFTGLSVLAWLGLPEASSNPLADFWRDHGADREVLQRVSAGGSISLFGTTIALDAHGFRAVPPPAPDAWRIAAIGGATTFGATRSADEHTWPAILEQEIGALACAVPVAVHNAGRLGRGLPAAVRGFETTIAPLRPQLLVVYPAPVDLVSLLSEVSDRVRVVNPAPSRVSSLLRSLESSWQGRGSMRRFREAIAVEPKALDLNEIPLARAYRQLLVKARQRGIDAVLLTAGLAVNGDSSDEAIHRHEALEARTRRLVLANRLHTRLVRSIGPIYRASVIDAGAAIDGADVDAFIDLFEPSESGRSRLARTLLSGLRTRLAGRPAPGCTPARVESAPEED